LEVEREREREREREVYCNQIDDLRSVREREVDWQSIRDTFGGGGGEREREREEGEWSREGK